MAVTKDGNHKFGIPDSPLNITNVTYIAEELSVEVPSEEAVIADDEGLELGRVIIPKSMRISGTLQLAAANTALPALGAAFIANVNNTNVNFLVTSVTDQQSQAQYAKVAFTAVQKIN